MRPGPGPTASAVAFGAFTDARRFRIPVVPVFPAAM
jgi:hypothetical protein